MLKTNLFVLFVLTLSFSVSIGTDFCWGETHREFQTGKLLDVTSDERLVEGTTVRHAIYQIQIEDVVYFGRGERVRRSDDPAHGLIVGDPVQVSVERDALILLRPDGKEIKTKIVRRQRADTSAAPSKP